MLNRREIFGIGLCTLFPKLFNNNVQKPKFDIEFVVNDKFTIEDQEWIGVSTDNEILDDNHKEFVYCLLPLHDKPDLSYYIDSPMVKKVYIYICPVYYYTSKNIEISFKFATRAIMHSGNFTKNLCKLQKTVMEKNS